MTPNQDLFWSTFVMTGFHGAHGHRGRLARGRLRGAPCAGSTRRDFKKILLPSGLYWHFVDLVWVLPFTSSTS